MEAHLYFSFLISIRGTLLDENGILKSVFNPDVIASLKAIKASPPPPPPVKSKNPFKLFSSKKKARAPPPNPTEDIVTSSTEFLVLPRTMMQDFFRNTKIFESKTMEDISQLFVEAFDAQKPQKEYTEEERATKLNKLKGKSFTEKEVFLNRYSLFSWSYRYRLLHRTAL